jgi:cell division inhibitor SepF
MGLLNSLATYFKGEDEEFGPVGETGKEEPERGNIISQNAGGKSFSINATAQLQVVLQKPNSFTDTKQIADLLNGKKTVILNLESTTPDVTRRIIDFLGGVAYANSGNIKPVSNNTFVITPYNVEFLGDELMSQLEENGVSFM